MKSLGPNIVIQSNWLVLLKGSFGGGGKEKNVLLAEWMEVSRLRIIEKILKQGIVLMMQKHCGYSEVNTR